MSFRVVSAFHPTIVSSTHLTLDAALRAVHPDAPVYWDRDVQSTDEVDERWIVAMHRPRREEPGHWKHIVLEVIPDNTRSASVRIASRLPFYRLYVSDRGSRFIRITPNYDNEELHSFIRSIE